MARRRDPGGKPPPDDKHPAPWPQSIPMPEVKEGGESTWELWHEAARQLDVAFAPTQPSQAAPLSVGTRDAEPAPRSLAGTRLSADALMVEARRHNRVCPRPELWMRLYRSLGGPGYVDLPPPPVDPWLWSKLSALQKRLFFREYVEWADRHGKLTDVAAFMDTLSEGDWLHMGEA